MRRPLLSSRVLRPPVSAGFPASAVWILHARLNRGGDPLHVVQAGGEKHPEGLAEVILVTAQGRIPVPVSLTAALAEEEERALAAGVGELSGAFEEADLTAAVLQVRQAAFIEIAQTVFVQHVKIARINAAVRFHRILYAADAPLVAGLRHKAQQDDDVIFKGADIGLPALLKIRAP